MGTVEMMIRFHMRRALMICCFLCLSVPTLGKDLLSCETTSPDASGYRCSIERQQCSTFALILTNSHYSSLSNLTFYLGLNRSAIAQANGFPPQTDEFLLPPNHPLLIPIDCKCGSGRFYAELTKTTVRGESFYAIAESLEGLTTCKAVRDHNPGVSPWNLGEKVKLLIPLRCACPIPSQHTTWLLLLSYPVSEGDTIPNLASKFNVTREAIISANNASSIEPFTSLLIPLNGTPSIHAPLPNNSNKPREPNHSGFPVVTPHIKKSKMWKTNLCIGLAGVALGVFITFAAAALFLIRSKHKKGSKNSRKEAAAAAAAAEEEDVELQRLNLSVRTASDKKVSFEGSQDNNAIEAKAVDGTPRRMTMTEAYAAEDIRRATEDFNSGNHIEGSVFQGRLNGKSVAIKRLKTETASKIDLCLFHENDALHRHPNILRMLGTSLLEGPESFLVFEFAENGSLKDWLHGGLAIKNQFIASCYCFLTWSQRLRICLHVASALQYMHHFMKPSYVHRNIKSRNIFLDEEFVAKIGNFGMAGCVENDTTEEDPRFYSTNPASWSIGYLAPEYVHQGVVSPSVDIFAYGVVLLEVLSGQTPISRGNDKGEGSVWLSHKIKSVLASGNSSELREWIDGALGENYSFDVAVAVANIARACVEEEASLRPSAREIVEKLSRLVEEEGKEEEQQHVLMSESSCKPLAKAVGKNH